MNLWLVLEEGLNGRYKHTVTFSYRQTQHSSSENLILYHTQDFGTKRTVYNREILIIILHTR